MEVTLHIPDDIAAQLAQDSVGRDLPRRALEAFGIEELKAGRITKPQLGEMLGLHRMEMDGFLKAHDFPYDGYTLEEINEQVESLKRLGF